MSGFRGTQNELLYSSAVAATALGTFTTEDNLMKGMPTCKLPDLAQLFPKVGADSSSLKFRALGQASATSTPTYTFSLRALTSNTWTAGGILLGSSNACTCVSGVTNGIWQVDLDIVVRTLAVPGTATITVVCGGTVTGSAFTSASNSIPAAGTSPAVTTLDMTAQYYLFLSAACSASSASNTINTQLVKLYGEN
jgi:hypothetical protein